MPRKKIILTDEYPYFVTGRTSKKKPFKCSMSDAWTTLSHYFYFLHAAFQFEIHCVVMMNNHFHAIIRTPRSNISEGMNYFMRETSKTINLLTDSMNQTWGGPYHWSLLKNDWSYLNAYKYTYQNPVSAGVSKLVEDYPYSSLRSLLGRSHGFIPITGDSLIYSVRSSQETLKWLNDISIEDFELVGEALRKPEYQFKDSRIDGKSKRPIDFRY